MQHADVVVVGGSAAGLTAAITARRSYPQKSVLIIRTEEHVLIPCGIPYVFCTVDGPDENLIPDTVLEKSRVDLVVDEATGIDRVEQIVVTRDGERIHYDRLVLATGSDPVLPPVPGADRDGVFAIRKDVALLKDIEARLDDVENVVVIGGGFIGVEFADECSCQGRADVTIVEMLEHCLMLAYDDEFCVQAEDLLHERGVGTVTGARVTEILGDGHVTGVRLQNGDVLPADLVLMAVGAKANTELAVDAGLALGPTGGIAVDRTMKTEDDHIFACGDCTEKVSFFGGRPCHLKLASIATAEARIAGANLFGIRRENIGTVGVWSTCLADTAFATAGMTESTAVERGYSVTIGRASAPNRHPGGMPDGCEMEVKLVFEEHSEQLLGGQIVGDKAAGELINAVSACIQRNMRAEDIAIFQIGTHPALTASPIAYQFVNAAEDAIARMR